MSHPPKSNSRDELPPELLSILGSSLKVGGVTGICGIFVGAIGGVLRSATPKLFAVASGIQWFALGSTFWAARGTVVYLRAPGRRTPQDMLSASAVAGGLSGSVGGLLRGPRNVVPGTIMFALFGAAGQSMYNIADARHVAANTPGALAKRSWMDSRWSPVKQLTDKDYEKLLEEKLLRVNAQIALVDESIARLEVEAKQSRQAPEEMSGR